MSFNLESLTTTAETRIFSEIRKSQDTKITAERLLNENNQVLLESTEAKMFDIFLAHKSEDAKVILGIVEILNAMKYRVYVDWIIDPLLDRNRVNKRTAGRLRERMDQSKSLFFATTEHANDSKWMPWELGYMDGKKDCAAILPIFKDASSSSDDFKGQEYLGIYPYCIKAPITNTEIEKLWICERSNVYVRFDFWLKGSKPYKHNN